MPDHHWKLTIRFSVVKDSMLTRDSSGNLQKHKKINVSRVETKSKKKKQTRTLAVKMKKKKKERNILKKGALPNKKTNK